MGLAPAHGIEGRFARRLLVAVAAATGFAHLLGWRLPTGAFWGTSAYAYYPPWVFVLGSLVLLSAATYAGAVWSRRPAAPELENALRPARAPSSEGRGFWVYAALALVGAGLFSLFRIAHILLGDGIALIQTLPVERAFHPLEPLSMFLEQAAYDALAQMLANSDRAPYEVAWAAAASLSVLAGAVFLPVCWAVAGHLARRLPGWTPGGPVSRIARPALALLLAAQGYVQVFFGYVEVYALPLVASAVYVLAALRFWDDEAPLWPAAAALAVAVALHLSAMMLVPSFAILVVAAVRDPARRGRRVRDGLCAAAALAALPVGLALLGHGYNLGETLLSLGRSLLAGQREPIPGYFWSWRHARDLLNEQMLVGPLAAAWFVPVAVAGARRRTMTGAVGFFLALGASALGVALLAGDSNLGYARNWDLLTPGGFACAVAGTALVLPRLDCARVAHGWLLLAVVTSCFHTLPWIGVNASPSRGVAWFASLPLGLGRTESTIGYWYKLRGDRDEAERWLVRALDINPGNTRAHGHLGDLYRERGAYDRASLAYRAAITLEPEDVEFRLRLVDALVRSDARSEALVEIERILERRPRDPRILSVYGIVLLGNHRPDDARKAFAAAKRNAPSIVMYRVMSDYADLPRGFERALDEVWQLLIR